MFLILMSSEDSEYTTSKKTVGTEGSEVTDTEITPKPRGTKKVAIRNQVGEAFMQTQDSRKHKIKAKIKSLLYMLGFCKNTKECTVGKKHIQIALKG